MAAGTPQDLHALSDLLKQAERVAAKLCLQLTVKIEPANTMQGSRSGGTTKGGGGSGGGILQHALAVLAEAGPSGLDRQEIHSRVQARTGGPVKAESIMSSLSRYKSTVGLNAVVTRQVGDRVLWFVNEQHSEQVNEDAQDGQEAGT